MPTTSGKFGWHLPVAGDSVDVVSDLAATVSDIEDSLSEFGIRAYRTRITVPAFSAVAVGAAHPSAPFAVTFPVGYFTRAPAVIAYPQDLPSGAIWVQVRCTEPTTSGVNVYAYNCYTSALTTSSSFDVAILAIQDYEES